MRTYKDITDEMESVRNEAREARELAKKLHREGNVPGYIGWKTRYNYLTIRNRALKNNSFVAFANDYKKPIMDILNKYSGKRIGPVTLLKIQDEFKEKLNMAIYFYKDYCDSFFVGFLSAEGYLEGGCMRLCSKGVYIDNTLGKMTDITVPFNYIEDVDAYILKLVKMQHELEELSQKLYNLAHDYNNASLEGMRQADYYKEFYNGYFEEWI